MTLTDLRWRLASAVWHPAATLDMWIHAWHAERVFRECDTPEERLLAGLEVTPGYGPETFPLRYRILRRLVVDPLAWLSDRIYPGWYEDERAKLSYWRGDA